MDRGLCCRGFRPDEILKTAAILVLDSNTQNHPSPMAQHTQDPPPPSPAMDPPPYDYAAAIQQPAPPDFAAAMQMAHLPLPLDTPLPPSSYDFTAHGAFSMPHGVHGPQAHPLFEGVLAMHHMLGHDLNLSWPDVADCSPQTMSYAAAPSAPYTAAEPVDPMPHWATPPPPIMDPTPSPLDESPEHIIELVSEPVAHHPREPDLDLEPSPSPTQRQPTGFAMFPLVVAGTKTHEHTIAFQADVRAAFRIHSPRVLTPADSSDKSQRRRSPNSTRLRQTSSGRSSATNAGRSSLLVWPRDARRHRNQRHAPTAQTTISEARTRPPEVRLSSTSSSRSRSSRVSSGPSYREFIYFVSLCRPSGRRAPLCHTPC